ncbi:PREDICTED: probable cytochrome P450 4aa1, partial [Wasmannia auropunctata]|uniref:probable cytochrome P450 4aa1 n=1 Tax=Wasmannia auropunctata TaxID=64793 RepID=UPI0005F0374C
MQKHEGKITMKSLQQLSYLERCIKEGMRLYPVASLIARDTAEDVKLQSYVVPAGTTVQLFIYG